ncbi:DUF7240 domain-containing protein [Mycolicibacterium fortuitum]|uniref:DUF7240 domain-containing protein n=1 Tax=Mycolicibacterium fortuitum TaxID=1766 RepID=UPI0020C26F0D|nr:hypothetical protein [Mycolicibacterium fortuitum]
MWEPPPGFDDILGDAQILGPHSGDYAVLTVPDIGQVRALRPRPDAVAHLAMMVNPKAEPQTQQQYSSLFVRDHLQRDDHERILTDMVTADDDAPDNPLGAIVRALATWGTARPYIAVMSLALVSATHWRVLRTRMRADGIPNPMAALTSMHDVLDEAEKLWLESIHTGNEDQDKQAQGKLFDQLYAPEPGTAVNTKKVRPAGFSPEEVSASFRAAFRALGAR